MEFCNLHTKIVKSSTNDLNKDLSNILSNRLVKELAINNLNDNIREQSLKISIDRNNNKHVLSPLGSTQGPRGIKVSRLSLQTSESSIRHSLVQQYGIQNKSNQSKIYNIKSIVLESAAGPSPTRWAIITFLTSQDAEKAIQGASKSQSLELHPGYELYEHDTFNMGTSNFQGLDEFHPQASRTLQISNLPQHLNNFKVIHDYFSKLGKVLDIEIKPKLVPHASALVQFSDISKVVKILSNPRSVLKNLVGSSITSSTSFQFGPTFPTNCIWLGHLANSIAENHVTEYFSRFGHVLEVVQDVKQQKALVYLDNAFAAQQSILHLKRKKSFLGNCRVQVDYASLECQATISYWLSNNFPVLPVPPENSSPKHMTSDSVYNCHSTVPSLNRSLIHQTSFNDKNSSNLIKATSSESYYQNPQINTIFSHKSLDDPLPYSQNNHIDSLSHPHSTISIKNSQSGIGNCGFNILDMVITDRVQADNAPRVTPIVNKRSSNIRLSTSYDGNCDNNSRINDHINEQSMNNISNQNQSTDYLSSSLLTLKKDRICLEPNNDGRNGGSIRLCNSQSNDLNKSDSLNRQFSPWNAPVRNRVVARVVPYPHTNSNAPNISHLNSSLTSKSNRDIQNTAHSIRGSSSIVSQNQNRNVHKSYSSYPNKESPSIKLENTTSVNHNLLHMVNDRDVDPLKRRTNYNQQVTYRVKNPEETSKSFDIRNSSFSGGHNNVKTKTYRQPDVTDKPVTAAEVFGEDFSDLSDNDSTPSYTSPSAVMMSESRKRKSSQMLKCKSPSSDSSSTMSVLSAEKQNRYVRVSKPYFHKKKSSLHSTSINRSKKPVKIKQSSSSEEERHGLYSSKISRHQIKFSIQEKPEKKNISMKPLTVNVSLSNFEDNILESDESSSRTTENSSENSSKVEINPKSGTIKKNKPSPVHVSKRKLILEKPQKYRTDDHHPSSSSENNAGDYNKRRYQMNSNKSKSYMLKEHDSRKMSKYILDRTYKENTYTTKMTDGNSHKSKQENEHHNRRKMSYNNSSHNFIIERQYHQKETVPLYKDNNLYARSRQRSESPPPKRQKMKHDIVQNNLTQRTLENNVSASSQLINRHNFGKHQKLHQELSSDAAFQKEFDEFKRDQAGDISQSSVSRKCNSSKMSSESSTGTKSFSSFKKYKAKKQELLSSSSKYNQIYDTMDAKNIFQIDMNNINIYESMYDKVKRRAHKQTESKVSQYPNDINEPQQQRTKKKSKAIGKESKHVTKESKSYHKRQRKSRERLSPSSSRYSRASSPLLDDSISNYSATIYNSVTNRKEMRHCGNFYKSTKSNVVSSFDSSNLYSMPSWKKKEEEKLFLMHKNVQKYKPESKSHRSKHFEHDFINDNDDHENNSEFSYVTNVSNVINVPSKSSLDYKKNDTEEIGNGSDATASTEPMEYAEVDFESLKLSDDDWKSGLSSQSSSESGAVMSTSDNNKPNITHDNKASTALLSMDKRYSNSFFGLESDIQLKINMQKKEDLPTDKVEENKYSLENEMKESGTGTRGIGIEESAKEEQDIAIASIMLKEESDCKSPIDWESRSASDVNLTSETVTGLFVGEHSNEIIIKTQVKEVDMKMGEVHNVDALCECEELEKINTESVTPTDVTCCAILYHATVNDTAKDIIMPAVEVAVRSITPGIKSEDNDSVCNNNSGSKESSGKYSSTAENVMDRPVSTSDCSLPDNSSLSNSIPSLGSKTQSTNKSSTNNNPTDKEHLTSYVKSVIERVMQEQSVENQNKLKLDKALSKRSKKVSGSGSSVVTKPVVVATTVSNSTTPVSVSLSLQKSPSVSYQAVVIENNEQPSIPVTKVTTGTAPSIPGVNVCSPVISSSSNFVKSTSDVVVHTTAVESSNPKTILTRSHVISIINLSSGTPSLKIDSSLHSSSSSSSSELKVNTDFTSLSSVISDVSSIVTDTNSTHTPSSILKSPNSDDQTKQRICTRLRRADPTKSDGNYKVVMTISTNKSEPPSHYNNVRPTNIDIAAAEVTVKTVDNDIAPVTETKPSVVSKISDPYEPNFDESPLELSHYRTKVKNTFFPSEEKSFLEDYNSKVTTTLTATITTTASNVSVATTIPSTSFALSVPTSTVLDSVSQVIDDVAHGNFNYNEYLTCFKNGRLPSLHISPSTTPLTFVSNDSRDCSSVSVDNQATSIHESIPLNNRRNNSSKHCNDDGKKLDNSLKHAVTFSTCGEMSTSQVFNDRSSLMVAEANSTYRIKTPTSNVSVTPIFSTNNNSQYHKDLFALINPTVLCRPVDNTHQKSKQSLNMCGDSLQKPSISSVHIQPYNILSNCSSLDKDPALINKFQLNVDSNLHQNVSKNNLLNISLNSSLNPILSSTPQLTEDKAALNQFYLNILKQRSGLGGFDSSALSQLQNILNEAHLKPLNPSLENNMYRMSQNLSNFESPAMLSQNPMPQETNNSSATNLSQNISSKFIAELIIPREYPLVWEGKLSLKNEEAKVALHFVHGNSDLLNACMHLLIFSGSLQWNNTGSLKIVQRMRLDISQLEGVQRRMQNTNEYCIGLALPGGDDTVQWMRQSQILKEGFIKYMLEKGAAGIINVCHPDNNQQGLYVVHIFPPCEFSNSQLCATAPQLSNIIDNNKVPSLLVIITTV